MTQHNTDSNLSRRVFVKGATALGALSVAASYGLVGCAPKKASEGSGDAKEASESYDLVVIGSGGAGMAAAIAAHDKGVENIAILEKMGVYGGNTNFSSSGMNASETKFQKEQGIEDHTDQFIDETLTGGKNTGSVELVTKMCTESAAAIDWLDSLGITLDNIVFTGGMGTKRCHRPTDGSAVGATLVPGLLEQVEQRGISIRTNCEVKKLILDGDKVTGVEVDDNGKKKTISGKTILLASGGLGSNQEMVTKYRPDLKGYVTTNQPGATGDGYRMAEEAGAELVQMDQIQIHPTVQQEKSTLIGEAVRGSGAILVNAHAQRFFDEMSTRDKVSAAELEQPESFAWLIFDQQVYDANKSVTKYDSLGLVLKGDNLDALAGTLQLDAATLAETVTTYNKLTTEGATDEFGRTQGLIELKPEGAMYAIKVAPGVHHEMGGVRIDTENRALDSEGNPIIGLYAAGEVTGGIHGNNRIGGNAVCDIIVFGKSAGEVIAEHLM